MCRSMHALTSAPAGTVQSACPDRQKCWWLDLTVKRRMYGAEVLGLHADTIPTMNTSRRQGQCNSKCPVVKL